MLRRHYRTCLLDPNFQEIYSYPKIEVYTDMSSWSRVRRGYRYNGGKNWHINLV